MARWPLLIVNRQAKEKTCGWALRAPSPRRRWWRRGGGAAILCPRHFPRCEQDRQLGRWRALYPQRPHRRPPARGYSCAPSAVRGPASAARRQVAHGAGWLFAHGPPMGCPARPAAVAGKMVAYRAYRAGFPVDSCVGKLFCRLYVRCAMAASAAAGLGKFLRAVASGRLCRNLWPRLAACTRSSGNNLQLRGLDHPRKRVCLTAMHNFFLTRADVTTSAERFFGQKPPRSMFVAILDSSSYRQLPSVRCDEPWARLKGIGWPMP
jgi:hypothetical protein